MPSDAEDRQKWIDSYLQQLAVKSPKPGSIEATILKLMKKETRSDEDEQTYWVLLKAQYRATIAYSSKARLQTVKRKADDRQKRERTQRAFDFCGLGIIAEILDPKTLAYKIDPALMVGRLLGVAGDDASAQTKGADTMRAYADSKKANKERRQAAIKAGKQERAALEAIIEQQKATESPRTPMPKEVSFSVRPVVNGKAT